MSSFIIDKIEYVKAAGLMYGYEEAKKSDAHRYFLEGVRAEFEHAYTLNVASVNEQYGEATLPDESTYDDEFEAYRKKGVLIRNEGYESDCIIRKKVADVMSREKFRCYMMNFFHSVLYQIENDSAHRAVAEFFFTCNAKLETTNVEGWWGEIEIAA